MSDVEEFGERGILVMAVSRSGRDLPELAHPDLILERQDVLVVCGPEDEVSRMVT